MLRELFDVKCRSLAVNADAFRGEFDVQLLQPAAGASANASFKFLSKTGEIEGSHCFHRGMVAYLLGKSAAKLGAKVLKLAQIVSIGMS